MFKAITGQPRTALVLSQKRFRVKKKWASNTKSKSPPELALGHFDTFYSPVYKEHWPSIRLALLSQSKHCALINTFANSDMIVKDLMYAGADDMISKARDTLPATRPAGSVLSKHTPTPKPDTDPAQQLKSPEESRYGSVMGQDRDIPAYDPADIHQFMPVKRVLSEIDHLLETELEQSVYEPEEGLNVVVIKDRPTNLPASLMAHAYCPGDVSTFSPPPKDETNKLAYYLMDAASILPVIALDLGPGDCVLDLCSAPGGKTLAMLQTHLPGQISCVDHSYSRLQRLRETLRWYTPKTLHDEGRIHTFHGNGVHFCQEANIKFDKILVDVPCYTDRHVLFQEDNNIFRKIRMKERLDIQILQKELLRGAVRLLNPGGTLVYSTCTLSMPQNDGTVHAVLEDVWQNTKIDLAVVDTSALADRFRDVFKFYDKCRFGQLVLPNVVNNFGPSYFAKIRRLQ